MNDTENLVPLTNSLTDENMLRGKGATKHVPRRKPLGEKPSAKSTQGKSRTRRALGDITNATTQPLQPLQKPRLKTSATKLSIFQDNVPEPEIIPEAPPRKSYEPAPLFSKQELEEMQRELDEEQDDGSIDEFGRPFTITQTPIPPPPYQEEEDNIELDNRHASTDDYFSEDQLFRKDELPVLELA